MVSEQVLVSPGMYRLSFFAFDEYKTVNQENMGDRKKIHMHLCSFHKLYKLIVNLTKK